MHDLRNSIDAEPSVAPDAYTATQTGAGVDRSGFDAVAVMFDVGTVTNDDWTFAIQGSDDDGSADAYAAVAAGDVDGAVPDAPTADTITFVGYHGSKRWLRVVATDGGSGDASFAVAVVRGGARTLPA